MESVIKLYKDLDTISRKARVAGGKLNCEKCPMKARCNLLIFDVCTYAFTEGFRKGYNKRKKEEKCKRAKKSSL